MLSTSEFIAILSLCITCFSFGYAVGSSGSNNSDNPNDGQNQNNCPVLEN